MDMNYYLATPGEERSAVVLFLHHNGKRYKRGTGITVPVKSWSRAKQRTNQVNEQGRLDVIRKGVTSYLDDSSSDEKIRTVLSFVGHGTFAPCPESLASGPTFMEFYTEWKDRRCPARNHHRAVYKAFCAMMGEGCQWDDFNQPFNMRLVDKMNERGYSANYQGAVLKNLKAVLNAGLKYGYHDNSRFKLWSPIREETFAIVLSPSEMELLWSMEGLTDHERKLRDLAWLGYLTASRFSDYSRFNLENINGERFVFVPEKTDSPVCIPCSPRIREILEHHGGHAPIISEQKFNVGIKILCRKAGIADVVQVPKSKRHTMGWSDERVVYKWELVSSHTFRRSGASALYRAGVPAKVIRFLTGHKTDKSLFVYIKLSAEDGYESLSRLDFFK